MALPTLSIVIPCYNEEVAIPRVLPRLRASLDALEENGLIAGSEVLVVDDHSSDRTSELLRNYPWVRSIRMESRSGYGKALKTGFAQAVGELIGFLDLDGTYDPADLESLIGILRRTPVEIVCGERFTRDAGMPRVRRIGNLFYSWLTRVLSGASVADVCTGFRIFRRRWVNELCSLRHDDLNFALRMTLWALSEEIPMLEIPIAYDRRDGDSKLRVVTHGPVFLWTIVYFFLRCGKRRPAWMKAGRIMIPRTEKSASARVNQSAT